MLYYIVSPPVLQAPAVRRSAAQVTMHRPAPAIAAAYTSHKSPLPPVFITGGNQPQPFVHKVFHGFHSVFHIRYVNLFFREKCRQSEKRPDLAHIPPRSFCTLSVTLCLPSRPVPVLSFPAGPRREASTLGVQTGRGNPFLLYTPPAGYFSPRSAKNTPITATTPRTHRRGAALPPAPPAAAVPSPPRP